MVKNRVMALDYGERKIGVALSDSLQMIAYPYKTIDRKKTPNYIGEIKNILEDKEVEAIVVGYPISMSGQETKQTKITMDFINELKNKLNIEIFKYDERLSSKEASRYLKNQNIKTGHNKEKIDQISASIILEQFLSSL